MYIYNCCDKNTVYFILLLVSIIGLTGGIAREDGLSKKDDLESSIILSTLFDSGDLYKTKNQKYKRNVNESIGDELEHQTSLQPESYLNPVTERALEVHSNATEDLEGRQITADRFFPGEFSKANKITADQIFPGEFPTMDKSVPTSDMNHKLDSIMNRIENDLHNTVQNALREMQFYVKHSVNKGQDLELGTRHNSNIVQTSKSLTRDEESDMIERKLQPSWDKLSLGSAFATGQADMTKALHDLPKPLLQEMTKVNEISDKLKELKSRKHESADLLSLIDHSDGMASRAINAQPWLPKKDASELLSASYLSEDDLSSLLKLLIRPENSMRRIKSDCKSQNPVFMYLVNVSPDIINSKVPKYNNMMRNKHDSKQLSLLAGRSLPKSDYTMFLDPREGLVSRRTPSKPLMNKETEDKNVPPLNDIYNILRKTENPFIGRDFSGVNDYTKNSLVNWLYDSLPQKQYEVIPHFDANLIDDLQSRQLLSDPSNKTQKRCQCPSLSTKYVHNLLRILESKPVTKSEFINYLLYIVDKTKSEPLLNDAILNESIVYDNRLCNC